MNIRTTLIAAGSVVALSGLATSAFASGSVTTTANASVTVISPVTLTKTQDMVFGQVVRPSSVDGNTVNIDTNDTVTLTGLGNGSVISSTTSSAKFNVIAAVGTTYTTTQTLAFVGGVLTGVGASLPAPGTGILGTVPAGGIQELRYGGHFDMTSSTPPAAYTGTLTVTVTYD